MNPWQVLSDCPHCRTEASVLELVDPAHPACHLGLACAQTCRMCGWATEAEVPAFGPRDSIESGRCPNCRKALKDAALDAHRCPHCDYAPTLATTGEPASVTEPEVAAACLTAWAQSEGEPDVNQFCEANIGLPFVEVVELYATGQVVGTSFDVIAFLFPGATGGMGAMSTAVQKVEVPPPSTPPPGTPIAAEMDPRAPARLLISVMVADGELRAGERQFIERFLAAEQLSPLSMDDIRVWRPHELGPVPDRELRVRLVEAAVHLMHLDRERDGSEWRVIRSYARAWGVPQAQVVAWDTSYDRKYAPAMSRLFRVLTGLVHTR